MALFEFCTHPSEALNWGWSGQISSQAFASRFCVVIGSCLSCASRCQTSNCSSLSTQYIIDLPAPLILGAFVCCLPLKISIFYSSVYCCSWHMKMLAWSRYRVLPGISCYSPLLVNSVYSFDQFFCFANIYFVHLSGCCHSFRSQFGPACVVSLDLT